MIVYTAIAGGKDELRPLPLGKDEGVRYVAFVDRAVKSDFWEVLPMDDYYHHPNHRRRSRYFKMHPHILFPDEEVVIWLDGSTFPLISIEQIIAQTKDYSLSARKHPIRSCLYDEGPEVIRFGMAHRKEVFAQLHRYADEGFPPGYGLRENRILVFKNTQESRDFMEAWWHEYMREDSCVRDQLCQMYVSWKKNFKIGELPLEVVGAQRHNHGR